MPSVRSPTALLLGVICTLVVLVMLYKDVWETHTITVYHFAITLSLTVALGAGHFMQDTTRVKAIGFFVLFIVGTILSVGLSGGRSSSMLSQSEQQSTSQLDQRKAQQNKVNALLLARNDLKRTYDEADEAEKTAFNDQRAACTSGDGTKCKGAKVTYAATQEKAKTSSRDYVAADREYWKENDKLSAMHVTPAHSELRNIARLYSRIFSVTNEEALTIITDVFPYLLAIVSEFASIMFINHAFNARVPLPAIKVPQNPVTSTDIAKELNIEPRHLRKALRDLHIAKPPQGWSWSRQEADLIKARITPAPNRLN